MPGLLPPSSYPPCSISRARCRCLKVQTCTCAFDNFADSPSTCPAGEGAATTAALLRVAESRKVRPVVRQRGRGGGGAAPAAAERVDQRLSGLCFAQVPFPLPICRLDCFAPRRSRWSPLRHSPFARRHTYLGMISCSISYDSFLLPSLQALPADFRPVVLTAEGRSATGQCFDVPYYKQASTCTTCSLPFLQWELLPVKCSRVAPSHDWSVSHCALLHTCQPSCWLHDAAIAVLAMAVWAVMTDKRPALCCSAATTMRPHFICIKNPADIEPCPADEPGADDAGRPHRNAALCGQGPVRGAPLPLCDLPRMRGAAPAAQQQRRRLQRRWRQRRRRSGSGSGSQAPSFRLQSPQAAVVQNALGHQPTGIRTQGVPLLHFLLATARAAFAHLGRGPRAAAGQLPRHRPCPNFGAQKDRLRPAFVLAIFLWLYLYFWDRQTIHLQGGSQAASKR